MHFEVNSLGKSQLKLNFIRVERNPVLKGKIIFNKIKSENDNMKSLGQPLTETI